MILEKVTHFRWLPVYTVSQDLKVKTASGGEEAGFWFHLISAKTNPNCLAHSLPRPSILRRRIIAESRAYFGLQKSLIFGGKPSIRKIVKLGFVLEPV